MKVVIGLLIGLCLWLAHGTANAQQRVKVGECYDQMHYQHLDIVETRVFNPVIGGMTPTFSQLIRPHQPGYSYAEYEMRPDPTGINLMQVKSAVPGVQFWIQRNRMLIAVEPTRVVPLGQCQFDQMWAAQFPAPFTPQPQEVVQVSFFSMPGQSPQIMARQLAGNPIPANAFSEGTYSGIPPLIDEQKARACLTSADGDESAFYSCIAGSVFGPHEKAAMECAQKAEDRIELGMCILNDQLGSGNKKIAQDAADCYAQYGQEWNAYPQCLAMKNAPPEAANLVNCVRTQMISGQTPNYWTMGLCALPKSIFNPNPETTIALECAATTGGQPKLFVACAGGRLLERELDKCFSGGIGTSNGCFGPNNSITQAYDQIESQLKNVLGANSVAFQAWQAARLSMDPYKMAEATRNVNREINRAITNTNIAIATAGRQAADAVAKVTPDVTIRKSSQGLPSITIRKPKWL
ncbi:hypothetical protein [Acinetobacter haemolyticus]|uniref:hypothetical protein n=1 Tax=Acinetobacter haemolyticus TaxID=29430 RepID=UPI000DE92EB7|nr:hypothetical protein [Acinetobacter haemolyticus]WHR56734.1 hypothetical protein PGW89_09725 [Acinetobacter haemolyticus]